MLISAWQTHHWPCSKLSYMCTYVNNNFYNITVYIEIYCNDDPKNIKNIIDFLFSRVQEKLVHA